MQKIFWTIIRSVLFSALFFFLASKTSAQTTLTDVQEKIAQKFTWEAKKDLDETMPLWLADSLIPKSSLFLTKGIVYDALVRESTVSQDFFLEEALSAYREVLNIAPKDTVPESAWNQAQVRLRALTSFLHNQAVLNHTKKDAEKAIFYYKACLRAQPKQIPLLKNLLALAWENKNYPLAKSVIFDLFRCEDFQANYFKMLLFMVGEQEKDYTRALKICAEAQHHFPKDTTFFFAKVNYLVQSKDHYAALELLEPVSESGNSTVLENLAFLHRQIGRLADAEKYWQRLYKLNTKNLQPIYNIAEMYFNQGINYLKQAPKYQIITTPNPYFEQAKPFLEQLYDANPKDEKIKAAYLRAKNEAKQPQKRQRKKDKILQPSPPTILITAPTFETDTFFTKERFIKIEGLLIDEDGGAEVNISGITGTVEEDRFSVHVPLREGYNELLVKGTNFDGLSIEKKLLVIRSSDAVLPKNHLVIFGTDEYEKQAAEFGHEKRLTAIDSILHLSYEGFSRLTTHRLTGKDATKEKLILTLRELSRNVAGEDNFIFIFSGKYHHLSPNNDTFLQTYSSEEKSTDLPASLIFELFKTIQVQNQLIIFDGKLQKNFIEKAERSHFEYVENFASRKIISGTNRAKYGDLLNKLAKLLEDQAFQSFYGYDIFFQLNLEATKTAEFFYMITDKAEGGDFLLKRKKG